MLKKKVSYWMARSIAVSMLFGSYIHQASASLDIEEQRKLYDQAQQWLDSKEATRYLQVKPQLSSYPLTPYLDYRTFLLDLEHKTPQEVHKFIRDYQDLPFSARIEKPYIQDLATAKQWSKLLAFVSSEPSGEVYQCYYYTAHWNSGDKQQAIKGGKKLWLSGKSVASQCDNLFATLEKNNVLNDELILQRIELAFQSNNPSLMKYLSRKLHEPVNQNQANVIIKLYDNPALFGEYLNKQKKTQSIVSRDWQLIKLGLWRLSRVSPEKTHTTLTQLEQYKLTNDQQVFVRDVNERLASYFMRTNDKKLADWRDKTLKQLSNSNLIQRRIRLAIEDNDWENVHRWVLQLDASLQQEPEWQYWLGRTEVELDKKDFGQSRLVSLLGQRNFYSVSVANMLNKPVQYPVSKLSYNPEILANLSTSLTRINELLIRGKDVAARSEWYWLLQRTNDEQKAALAQYALERNWSHFSVVAAIKAKLWDNVELRFPITHLDSFKQYASEQQLDPITLLSLARQESALNEMAHSPVGARGLMQLMPKTAQATAKKYQLVLNNEQELYQADKNIEIGSRYFSELMQRYGNNRVLALAAYNAGPSRVDRWLKERGGKLDVFQFIESIPFNETRRYVQNILMFETYYRNQLGVDRPFLKEVEINKKY